MPTVRVEFTIEPFEAGVPGPHVVAAVEAARGHGAPVEVGPFATSALIAPSGAPALVQDVLRAALLNGATRVSLQVERVEP